MKKLFAGLMAAAMCAAAVCAFAACDSGEKGEKFTFAGSLNELYGDANGYPQAVLVATTSVIQSDPGAVGTMLSYMEGSAVFLAEAQPSEVAALLQDYYTEGLTPQLNANNLTAQVIKNCAVGFASAADEATRTRVNGYLSQISAIDETAVSAVGDAFYYTQKPDAGASSAQYSVYAPDGAPALALANAVKQQGEGSTFSFHIVAANTIAAQVTGASPQADFCILPLNAASKQLGTGEQYQMLGVVTNGNMYFLTANGEPALTLENLSSLAGKTVGVVQYNNVPGLTLRAVFQAKEIGYQLLGGEAVKSETLVNLKPIQNAAAEITLAGDCDYYLCPEPVASAKVAATAQ